MGRMTDVIFSMNSKNATLNQELKSDPTLQDSQTALPFELNAQEKNKIKGINLGLRKLDMVKGGL
jgi:hypothetical protein